MVAWARSEEWSGEKIRHGFGEKTPSEQSDIAVLRSGSHMARWVAAWLCLEHDRSGSVEYS